MTVKNNKAEDPAGNECSFSRKQANQAPMDRVIGT